MTHARLPLVAGLAAAALTIVPAALGIGTTFAATGARTTSHRDATHDVVMSQDNADGTGSTTVTPVPERTNGDVRKITTTYRAHAVHVRATFTDLRRPTVDEQLHVVRIAAAHGLSRNIALFTSSDKPKGELLFNGLNPPHGCEDVSTHVDYAADVVVFDIPRSCVKQSPWVRVGFGLAAVDMGDMFNASADPSAPAPAPAVTAYQDDAYRDGTVRDNLTLGPRVHH